ncbi:PAS domain-containing hybrid sensor histidine kinase/response regulator [Massilia niastensis]|uniref:PAS domain-containing hybrid sensor histidine kinase/response regulator n=1 Tax=Massilia niastensis TaxID=544911 RepID=UPI00039E3126|nr:PAS domain S-box protein [Massilia niastensis]
MTDADSADQTSLSTDFPAGDAAGEQAMLARLRELERRLQEEVAARERAERMLALEQRRSNRFLRSLKDGFVLMDHGFRVLQVNAAGIAIDGRPESEIVGRTHWELWPGSEHLEIGKVYERVMREREPAVVRNCYHHKDRELWFDIHAYPDEEGIAVVYRDITRQERTERELLELSRKSEQRRRLYETILSNTPDLAYVWDLNHRFTYANEVLLKMWGMSWDEAIGRNCLEIGYEPWHAEMHGREIEQVKATRAPVQGEVPFNGTFGRRIYDYILVPVIGPNGDVEAVAGTTRDITERKESEMALKLNEERFRSLVTASTQIVWQCGGDGAVHEDSPSWRAFTGRTQEQMAGFGWRDAIHPDDRQRSVDHWGACVAGKRPYETEQRLLRFDGQYRWTLVRAVPLFHPDGAIREWVGTHTDIQDRKEAEIDRQRFVSLAERSTDFIGMCGADMVPFFLNQAAIDMVGGAREMLLSITVDQFMHPDDRAFIMDSFFPQVARDGHAEAEIRFRHFVTGEPIWMIYSVYALFDVHGKIDGYGTVSRNITERKLGEEQLRHLATDLSAANNRKTEFLATLAHELRNPLAPLRTGLDLMRLANHNGTVLDKAHDMMDRQLRQMVHLIDDLMDISRINSGKIELKRTRVEIKAVVASAIESVLPMVESAHHKLDVVMPEQGIWLDADPTRLAQILVNLLANACKYTPNGGLIALTMHLEGDAGLVIAVRDSGIGIPRASLDEVFEMFSQVSQNMGRAQGGLGIGLALVRSLVRLHGGAVSADSAGPGHGTTVTVRLPVMAVSEPGPGRQGARSLPAGGAVKLRVLIADDNVDAATMLAALLETAGHAVTVVHDGHAALRAARDGCFELLILDIGMPGLTGYEAAAEIRKLPHMRHALLAAHTGWGAKDDRARALGAGFDAHLTKPAGMEDIEHLIAQLRR